MYGLKVSTEIMRGAPLNSYTTTYRQLRVPRDASIDSNNIREPHVRLRLTYVVKDTWRRREATSSMLTDLTPGDETYYCNGHDSPQLLPSAHSP